MLSAPFIRSRLALAVRTGGIWMNRLWPGACLSFELKLRKIEQHIAQIAAGIVGEFRTQAQPPQRHGNFLTRYS